MNNKNKILLNLTNENKASQVLDLTLRREWNRAFENPSSAAYERGLVKKLFQKVPKTNTRMVKLVRNVAEDEAAMKTLKNAVKRGDVNTVKKLYHPKFFFELAEKATNANVINAMIPPKASPETLIGHLISMIFIKPSTIAQIIKSRKISMENLIAKKVFFKLQDFKILNIFKEFEKITKKRIDFSKVQKKDMISWFSRYSTYARNRIGNDDFETGVVLLQFMNDRGAPLIPMQLLLDCAVIYMDEESSWINIPEFYTVLDMYYFFREPVKTGTLYEIFLYYAVNMRDQIQNNIARMTGQLRAILDNIDIPRNIINEISNLRSIPAGIIDYLVMRGASVNN
jgi:hypothetical protein